ncbi:MAG: MATE family efflux transporter, partial [Firmicutes bacterium]|nr:MATE family efflux transporter [Bacillota bacterium]
MARAYDLTVGNETKALLRLALPMIAGNLIQQLYNVTDTIIVGRFIGPHALAAVGSSFAVMVLLNSIILGFCMGSGTVFSIFYGAKEIDKLKNSFFVSFCLVGALSVVINFFALFFINEILMFLRIPLEIWGETKLYLQIIFYGITFTSAYNYFAALLRSLGNSVVPLIFLAMSTIINIVLDIVFIVPWKMGVGGAAYATIIAQGVSAVALAVYCLKKVPIMRLKRKHFKFDLNIVKMIGNHSILTSMQQSVMNFGILMIQGLVNSFGVAVMAAFAAVVKIESFAYLPEQELGNAFSIFIAQNFGAKERGRIQEGIRAAVKIITIYGVAASVLIILFAKPLLSIFISVHEREILQIGIQYLYIVAGFYCLIGYLFMF